ncbi:transposase [Micromonospora sp. CPCC 206171]|uniref:transposase n=1 Tax=Micromonospora sp. CPCC 206171 TaxID=3122405 RepID=UPI002FF251D0
MHPKPIRELRNLTRYRRSLIRDRTREMQRVEKLLEDAQIKITSVVSDVFVVSGRLILHALIDGQRDPTVLAQMARGRLRVEIAQPQEALRGFFTDHHGAILAMMLDNIDRLTAQITALDTTIAEAVAPFARQVAQLSEITAVGPTAAQELIADVGVDMTRFPSDAHLVSWAKFCPQTHEPAGIKKNKGRAKGSPWLAATLGNIAGSACRTDSFLGARHRRIAKRRGKQKATVATGNAVLVIVYHLLSDPAVRFRDLGADHFDTRIDKQRRARNPATQLQAVTGQKITIRDGKAIIAEPEPEPEAA